jgi:hypothetical protein
LVFKKNANFFAENWEKSQKIVIITSTPGADDGEQLSSCCKLLIAGFGSDILPLSRSHRLSQFALINSRLPDGLFSHQKSQFEKNFEDLRLQKVDIFYVHLEYLWTFVIFYDHSVHFVFIWYIFSSFGIRHQEKSGNPGSIATFSARKNMEI